MGWMCRAHVIVAKGTPLASGQELLKEDLHGCPEGFALTEFFFAMDMALNNFSLGYVSIAMELIIRFCLPLTTFLSQQTLANFGFCDK